MQIISTEYPYMPMVPGIEAAVLAVLVKDGQGKYRAYIGLARHPDDRLTHEQRMEDAQYIANQGRKLSYAKAVPEYFVGFTAAEYVA